MRSFLSRWAYIALGFRLARGFSIPAVYRSSILFAQKQATQDLLKVAVPPMVGFCMVNAAHQSKAQSEGDQNKVMLLDDMGDSTSNWYFFADGVMGGVSQGTMSKMQILGRPAIMLRGSVSLENNGGFIQIARDLAPAGGLLDAGSWTGFELDVYGDGQSYNIHLRTDQVQRVFQSYRYTFETKKDEWQTLRIPFSAFTPYRIDAPLDVRRLRRLGILAIGREMQASVAVGGLRLYRE